MEPLNNTPCKEHGRIKGLHKMGYLHVSVQGVGKVRLHRLVYCQHNGLSLSDIKGKVVRHTCDNGKCIEPTHLIIGTIAENNKDRDDRHRGVYPKGEHNGRSILKKEDVEYIRKIRIHRHKEFGSKALSKKFGVSPSTIDKVVSGENWKIL